MPTINQDLQITKNEITLQVFKVKNSERAGKVLVGQSTDMQDVMNLCNYYKIDICQFMMLADGSHPIMLHRDEYARLREAATRGQAAAENAGGAKTPEPASHNAEPSAQAAPCEEPAKEPRILRFVNDANVNSLIELLRAQEAKIGELYERIVALTEQNMALRTNQPIYGMNRHLADGSSLNYAHGAEGEVDGQR